MAALTALQTSKPSVATILCLSALRPKPQAVVTTFISDSPKATGLAIAPARSPLALIVAVMVGGPLRRALSLGNGDGSAIPPSSPQPRQCRNGLCRLSRPQDR